MDIKFDNDNKELNIESLDFDIDIVCENDGDGDPCTRKAEYRMTKRCCGKALLLCEECVFEILDYFNARKSTIMFTCQDCQTTFPLGEVPVAVYKFE